MNTKEHLLTCLAEECAEIQQAVSKALRFGLDDGYPDADTTNAQDIAREYIDLMAVVDLCREHGIIKHPKKAKLMYGAKQMRVKQFMDYARERGALDG
ncbi:MAG: hypothetical protein AB2747_05190 [Candidatus Thiodiazotropha taylori]